MIRMSKKHKPTFFRQMSKEDITRVDENTFYHPSKEPDMKGEPYMVFHETVNRDRWLCDCMNFVVNIIDSNGPVPSCKHIKNIKKEFNIT
jgi:hypothetical protein